MAKSRQLSISHVELCILCTVACRSGSPSKFVAGGIFVLPVLAVILVAFAGGLTDRARQVVQAAVSILAVALGLGVVS